MFLERAEGYLCAERLAWLEQRLAEAPERPTLIFMHHPPFLTGLAPLDTIGLTNADMLGAVIARHPAQIRMRAHRRREWAAKSIQKDIDRDRQRDDRPAPAKFPLQRNHKHAGRRAHTGSHNQHEKVTIAIIQA